MPLTQVDQFRDKSALKIAQGRFFAKVVTAFEGFHRSDGGVGGELNVLLPPHRGVALYQVRPQEVATFRDRRPITPPPIAGPGDRQGSLAGLSLILLDLHIERARGTPAPLPQSPQTFMSNSQVLRSTAVDLRFQFLQTGFHAFFLAGRHQVGEQSVQSQQTTESQPQTGCSKITYPLQFYKPLNLTSTGSSSVGSS